MQDQPTRRTFLASLAAIPAAPLASLPAAAGSPLADAIARHRAAFDAFTAVCDRTDSVMARAEGREVTDEDWAIWGDANEAEAQAFHALGRLPCAGEAERRIKIGYIVERLRRGHGPHWAGSRDHEALALVLQEWLGGGA